MKTQVLNWLLLSGICISWLSGCIKGDGSCFSGSGDVVFQQRNITEFDSIRIQDHVNVILRQGSVNSVTVEAGENIIGGILTELSGRELVISNVNQCNWLRSYNKPLNVHLTVRNLQKIHYESSGNIISLDTIRSPVLKIHLWGGCGDIDLLVNIGDGTFIQHLGTATLVLKGKCNVSNVYAGDFGLLQLKELRTGYTFVISNSSNDCYVNARHQLSATINSIGNIYYSGNPAEIVSDIKGAGRLIPY